MQAPSLYTHFDSKLAIYDAMFGQAWSDYEGTLPQFDADLPDHPRDALHRAARHFFDYATADLARHQLMNQRIIPGFEPSPGSYAAAVRVLERGRDAVARLGDVSADDFDIWIAVIGGLINQHHANDPGGTYHAGLLARAVDMWADAVGLPPSPRTSRRPSREE
jgi:AcrR family transcriptional regulator